MGIATSRKLRRGGAIALALGLAVATGSAVAQDIKPLTVRIASDFTGPPHPGGVALEHFKLRLPEVIPGSELRVYYASSLYNIPEAIEAMTEGNLEMTWGQFGKSAVIEPFMNVVIGPQLMSTPGAINSLDKFETFAMLRDRMKERHDVEIFGTGHMSMFMGAGAGFRLLAPADFAGKKIRSMGPAENAALQAWGASPTTMPFGDVPPALQTGVIDGLLTALGGFNVVKEQAPYFTIAGINGIVGDYYWIGAGGKWWRTLDANQQAAIRKLVIEEVIPLEKQANWCNDKRLIDLYKTDDPSKPGIYIMNAAEQKALADKLGTATADWVKKNSPTEANVWVDKFAAEARAAVAANPLGSDPLEKTDCEAMKATFAKYLPKK